MFLFSKNFCSVKCVLLSFFILSCKSIWLLLSSLSITPKYLKFSTLSSLYFFIFKCPILCSVTLFQKSCSLWGMSKKMSYGRTCHRWQYITTHALCMPANYKATDTHTRALIIYNTSLLFHDNIGYANMHQYCVTRTLPFLSIWEWHPLLAVFLRSAWCSRLVYGMPSHNNVVLHAAKRTTSFAACRQVTVPLSSTHFYV